MHRHPKQTHVCSRRVPALLWLTFHMPALCLKMGVLDWFGWRAGEPDEGNKWMSNGWVGGFVGTWLVG